MQRTLDGHSVPPHAADPPPAQTVASLKAIRQQREHISSCLSNVAAAAGRTTAVRCLPAFAAALAAAAWLCCFVSSGLAAGQAPAISKHC